MKFGAGKTGRLDRSRPRARSRRSVAGEDLWWPPRELAGVTVSEDTAWTYSAFYCAANVLSTDTAALPLRVWRSRPDGGRDLQAGHDVDDMLRVQPNEEMGAMTLRQSMMASVCGWGNGMSEIVRSGRGKPLSLELMDTASTRPVRDPTTNRVFYKGIKLKTPLESANVLHFKGISRCGLWGLSPVKMHRQGIALGLATQAFGATYFGNGTTPSGHLETDKVLKKEARQNLREEIRAEHGGPYNAHRLLLLQDGIKWVKNSTDPEDAQFLSTRAFEVLEICRIFRLPPHKLADFSQAHLSNIEAANLDYLMTSLMPWLVMIEQECTRKLFSKAERMAGFYAEHDFDYILRADSKARGDFYNRLFGLSVLTGNDVARRENVNPIGPEGDRRYVSVNFQTVENAVKGKAAGKPAKPKKDDDGEDDGNDAGDEGQGTGGNEEGGDDGDD